MSGPEDRTRVPIRNRFDPLGWMSEEDRAKSRSIQFSPEQLAAIERDTRLPGEVASAYGVSAAVIVRLRNKMTRARGGKSLSSA